MENSITIRKLTYIDGKDALAIWSSSYNFEITEQMIMEFSAENVSGLFGADDNLIACADFIPVDIRFHNEYIKMIKIYRIATSLTERNKGFSKKFLIQSFRDNKFSDCILSWLMPADSEVYKSMGFIHAPMYNQIQINPTQFKGLKVNGKVVLYSQNNHYENQNIVNCIISLYKTFTLRYDLMEVRDKEKWSSFFKTRVLSNTEKLIYWEDATGAIRSYMILNMIHSERKQLRIREIVWYDVESAIGLFAFLNTLSEQFEQLVINLPLDFPIEYYVRDVRKVVINKMSLGMYRIINVEKALCHLNKPSDGNHANIYVYDENIPENTGLFSINWYDDSVIVNRIQESETDNNMNICSIQMLTRLLTNGFTKQAIDTV